MNVPCNFTSKLATQTALLNIEVSIFSLRPYFILIVRRFAVVVDAFRFTVGLDDFRKKTAVKSLSNRDSAAESKLCDGEENHVREGDGQ